MILFTLAVLLGSGHAAALREAPTVPGAPTAAGDCCESEDPCTEREAPVPDDCCPNSCHHCSLPCCGGTVALVLPLPDAPVTPADSAPVTVSTRGLPPGADPHEIYHPPRA